MCDILYLNGYVFCVTILILFSYHLLLSKIEVVLSNFVLKLSIFFVVLTSARKIQLVQLESRSARFLEFLRTDWCSFSKNRISSRIENRTEIELKIECQKS